MIQEKWIKASIAGTLWAASEIVLGSFLHNLRVPFTGNILTAIGLVILISVSYVWKDKGLFWRAGLICALMKTLSPSAVIFGPMIAIFTESLLLEISVCLFGRTVFGFILGSMLAMSWNLFHKIINFIIVYGYNIVELYTNLVRFAEKQLNLQFDGVWLPILALLLVYGLLGLLAAILGIRTGRKILSQAAACQPPDTESMPAVKPAANKPEFSYSLIWLFADLVLMTASLVLLNFTPWMFWSIFITGIVTVWAFRYKTAMRQLSKPKFWIFFVLITMVMAFIFTKVQGEGMNWETGLLIGLQMNFRAAAMVTGFSVLGTELYNPVIRKFFLKTYFRQLPLALELSFESLPSMIAHIPDFKTLVRNPVSVISRIVSQAGYRLEEIRNQPLMTPKVFIITGAVGEGKTTLLQRMMELFRKKNVAAGGILCPRVMDHETTTGYDILDIVSGEREQFLRLEGEAHFQKLGRYRIFPQGLQLGLNALMPHRHLPHRLVIIDEVGNLELDDQGWAPCIWELMHASRNHLVLAVRKGLTAEVIRKWNFTNSFVYDISENKEAEIVKMILEQI